MGEDLRLLGLKVEATPQLDVNDYVQYIFCMTISFVYVSCK